jgi:hypothetical protein
LRSLFDGVSRHGPSVQFFEGGLTDDSSSQARQESQIEEIRATVARQENLIVSTLEDLRKEIRNMHQLSGGETTNPSLSHLQLGVLSVELWLEKGSIPALPATAIMPTADEGRQTQRFDTRCDCMMIPFEANANTWQWPRNFEKSNSSDTTLSRNSNQQNFERRKRFLNASFRNQKSCTAPGITGDKRVRE